MIGHFIFIVSCVFIGGAIYSSVRDEVLRNGWAGFLVKVALYFDCLSICFLILAPQIPWRTMTSVNDIHMNAGSVLFAVILYIVCAFPLMSARATPWLLKPAVKWPLFAFFALAWLLLTGTAFVIVCLHLTERLGL